MPFTSHVPVDPRGPRVAAALTSLVLAAALLTGSVWLLVAQAAVFALGSAHRSPYAVVFRRIVRPRLGPPASLEDPRPLRFAQLVGLLFVLAALAGVTLSVPGLTLAATAGALAAAFLNAAFGICLGCEAYLLTRRAGRPGRRAGRPGTPGPSPSSAPIATEVPA